VQRERFLQDKIEHEATTIAKLINLPHQHALIVLRVCVQQNLRHLQRSFKWGDLVHLWDKLDSILGDGVARIRGLPRPTDNLEAALISLPVKMGRVSIMSYRTVAPHAYAAAPDAAGVTIAPVLRPGALTASTQLTTQHQPCQENVLLQWDGRNESQHGEEPCRPNKVGHATLMQVISPNEFDRMRIERTPWSG
jgi:hypothetical protein